MDLNNRIAIVTGANGGLGDALVRQLAARCEVVHAGVRDPDAYDPPARNVRPLHIDLGSRAALAECVEAQPDPFAAADILINNAGALAVGLLEEIDADAIYNSLQVNLTGLIDLTRRVLPGMLGRGEGAIVNNASFSGYVHFPMASVYAASKAGVVAFSEALRRELDGTGVQVTHMVTPGVDTTMLDATEAAYGDHFDTSGWDKVTPDHWAAKTLTAIQNGAPVVQPGGKTRAAILASRGPGQLLDAASRRMFTR